ncbi:unnamed protein product [Meloidogyne enterolobii]|uniref:Uncharacterized protein n=2 Tax=Meloidogyne enterolobii TaxID=390850 RepID=A0ACB0XY48_MELEN
MSPVITTQSETTTSLFSTTPTSTPLTSNSSSSSSTLQKSKQKSLGKRLWVVGRGNNSRQKKTRLFLLDENGCQRKYSSEDAAMQRLWRPNSIAIGDDNINYSVKNERGKRRKRILLRIGTLASLVAVGSCFLLLLWVFIFWHNDESFKLTQSQKNNSSISSILPLSPPTTINIFDNTSLIQTTTLKSTAINSFLPSSTNNYFISSSSPKISTTINNKIYSTTFQTPRPQELKFSIMLLNTNLNEKKILDNSPKIIQIHDNIINKNKINSPSKFYRINKLINFKVNISTKSFVEVDRFENSQNVPNETIKAVLENGNKLGTISTTTTERIKTSTTPTTTTSTTLITTTNLIQTNNYKTTIKSNNNKLLNNYYLPSKENSITKIGS